jgi:hypothetical protein
MKKPAKKPLSLRSETIAVLDSSQLRAAQGAWANGTSSIDITLCWCNTDGCTMTCRTECIYSVCVECAKY